MLRWSVLRCRERGDLCARNADVLSEWAALEALVAVAHLTYGVTTGSAIHAKRRLIPFIQEDATRSNQPLIQAQHVY